MVVYVNDFKTKPKRSTLNLGAFISFVIDKLLSSSYYLMHLHPTDLSLRIFIFSCSKEITKSLTI